MAGRLADYRKALNVAETASLAEVRAAFDRVLQDEMSPEDVAAMKKKQEEEAAAKEAAKKQEMAEAGTLAELRTALGLGEDAGLDEILTAAKALSQQQAELKEKGATSGIALRELSDRVAKLEPQAKLTEQLLKERAIEKRDGYLTDMLRKGRMAPADRSHYEEMWALSEAVVRKHLDGKKDFSVVKLHEVGSDAEGADERPVPGSRLRGGDPREFSLQLAERVEELRAKDPALSYMSALEMAKAENPELVEAAARKWGPPSA